jgi:acyl-CoA dehydrogenase
MDFELTPEIEALRARIERFVTQRLIPLEADAASYDAHENIAPALLETLRGEAKAAGLWALQVPQAWGGQGLPVVAMAACYEAMNASIFGPVVFNSAAPDDGNMMVLAKIGTDAQRERWLRPIVDGRVRSAFAMTEPHPSRTRAAAPIHR